MDKVIEKVAGAIDAVSPDEDIGYQYAEMYAKRAIDCLIVDDLITIILSKGYSVTINVEQENE